MKSLPALAAVGTAIAAVAALVAWQALGFSLFTDDGRGGFVAVVAASWALFGLAFVLLRRVAARHVAAVVIAGALAIGGAGLLGAPNTSTDSARYAWDGIVADAGVSPYADVPAADSLETLRTDWLFPPVVIDPQTGAECTGARILETAAVPSGQTLCTAINRPHVPTIYPPLAELYFAGVRGVVPAAAEYWPFQVGGLFVSLGVTVLLLVALRRRGMDGRSAAAWAWCPLVVTEAVTNSHVDALGALLALAATLLVANGRRVWGGVALGAAIAVKLIPGLVAPPLLRTRKPWVVALVAVGTFAAFYVPYVVASGFGVVGYLPGYLNEEGFDDGSRFALLSIVFPGQGSLVAAGIAIAALAVLCWWRADRAAPWNAQVVLVGATFLVVSPGYAWYALLLIPFIALSHRWEWFAVPLAMTAMMMMPSITTSRVATALAVIVVISAPVLRRPRSSPRSRSPRYPGGRPAGAGEGRRDSPSSSRGA
jgi:hypothetical protein